MRTPEQRKRLTSTGGLLCEIANDAEIRIDDLAYLIASAQVNWGVDFSTPDTDAHDRCVMVWEQARRDKWGSREFQRAVDAFMKRQEFATWTVASFFATTRSHLHPYSWYQERIASHPANRAAIAAYNAGGFPLWGWIHEIGDELPQWEAKREAEPRQLSDRREGMDDDTRAAYLEWKERTARELAIEDPDRRPKPMFDEPPFADHDGYTGDRV